MREFWMEHRSGGMDGTCVEGRTCAGHSRSPDSAVGTILRVWLAIATLDVRVCAIVGATALGADASQVRVVGV